MAEAGEDKGRIAGAIEGKLELNGGVFADDRLVQAELEYLAETEGEIAHIKAIVQGLRAMAEGQTPEAANEHYTIGLALSGGGIRSAIVSLGVMQHLAGKGLLAQVDYLSTVSGGGFIGSALSWWSHNAAEAERAAEVVSAAKAAIDAKAATGAIDAQAAIDAKADIDAKAAIAAKGNEGTASFDLGENFPFGTQAPNELPPRESHPLTYLRENGRYLVPGNGHGMAAAIAVVLRAIFLNLLVWIPLVALVFIFLHWAGDLPIISGLSDWVADFAKWPTDLLNGNPAPASAKADYPSLYLALLLVAVAVVVFFAAVSINLSLQSWLERGENGEDLFTWERLQTRLERTPASRRWTIALVIGLATLAFFCWITFMAVSIVDPVLHTGFLKERTVENLIWPMFIFGLFIFLFGSIYFCGEKKEYQRFRKTFNLVSAPFFIVCLYGLLVLFFPWLIDRNESWTKAVVWLWAIATVTTATSFFLFVFFLLGHVIRNILHTFDASLRYGARRQFEKVFGIALVAALACTAVGVLPIIVKTLDAFLIEGPSAAASLFLGIVSAIWGHYRIYLRGLGDKGTGLTMMIGSLLLLYGIMVFGYMIADFYHADCSAVSRVIIIALITVSAITGWFTNLNYMSLHRFYRDRLAEAFLPDYRTTKNGVNAPADGADRLPIAAPADWADGAQIAAPAPAGGKRPKVLNSSCKKGIFHIINANVILDRSKLRKYQARGGDSFMLSPLYCGSNATGWERSTGFAGGELTLASAMAISGAAANPRSGMVGTGITRNGLVSLAMSLLSLRLGYWIARPLKAGETADWQTTVRRRANHFFPSALYAIKYGYSETSNFLELTDGGHFENLGFYELVRRRCGLIIICDGGQDPDSSYQSLTFAALRIKEDFGALLKFNVSLKTDTKEGEKRELTSPGALVARETSGEFPKGAEFADRGFFLASVDYGARGGGVWPKSGLIIYMKSAMIKDLGLAARGYKGAHPDFPYQSTSDQFFETDQFEAYREVGHKICAQMLRETQLENLFKPPGGPASRPPLDQLQNSDQAAIRIEKNVA